MLFIVMKVVIIVLVDLWSAGPVTGRPLLILVDVLQVKEHYQCFPISHQVLPV